VFLVPGICPGYQPFDALRPVFEHWPEHGLTARS